MKFTNKGVEYWNNKVKEHYGNDFELVSIGDLEKYNNRHFIIKCVRCGVDMTTSTNTLNNRNKRGYCKNCGTRPNDRKPHEQLTIRLCECGSVLPFDKHIKICAKCKRDRLRENYRRKDLKRRTQLKDSKQDKDITLKKLYAKDNGVCYLCGCFCNWNDYQLRGAYFVVGKTYPTIEHVKPLSRGGAHSWSNVRLACHYCNSKKSDKAAG